MSWTECERQGRQLCREMVLLRNGDGRTVGYVFDESEGGLGIAIVKGEMRIAMGHAVSVCFDGACRSAKIVKVVEFPEGYCIDVNWVETVPRGDPSQQKR